MKKEFLDVISEQLGVQPVFVNSALLSAQNRQRYYWANWKFDQPEDRGIVLADILEDGEVDRDKAYCIDACYHKGGSSEQYFNKPVRVGVVNKGGQGDRIYSVLGKSISIGAQSGGTAGPGNLLIKVVGMAQDKKGHDIQRRIHSPEGKSPTLLAINSGGAIPPKVQTAESENYIENISYRKLTPVECERLQTIPDNYSAHVSNTQRYKMLGNGWTVDVIAHIFSFMQNQ
ncbi:MAG TPA: DNA cytosine methyltransferase, partial [Oligella sp.]|nr:DNA cytosine methyltransferase [Oligella sp.]